MPFTKKIKNPTIGFRKKHTILVQAKQHKLSSNQAISASPSNSKKELPLLSNAEKDHVQTAGLPFVSPMSTQGGKTFSCCCLHQQGNWGCWWTSTTFCRTLTCALKGCEQTKMTCCSSSFCRNILTSHQHTSPESPLLSILNMFTFWLVLDILHSDWTSLQDEEPLQQVTLVCLHTLGILWFRGLNSLNRLQRYLVWCPKDLGQNYQSV